MLRYTRFIEKIKKILESGEIGEVITMQLNENKGFWHHAHSYVRGSWNNSETSSPLIVAKFCHNFYLMMYLLGSKCISVSLFGNNSFFSLKMYRKMHLTVFTVSAFFQKNTRTIKIMGTKGDIGGCMEECVIVLKRLKDI